MDKEEREKYEKDREALRKLHERLRKEKALGKGYQELKKRGIDIDKNLKVTFAVIEKMHYSDFNNGVDGEVFKPSDIIDEDDLVTEEDEVLMKFKSDQIPEYNSYEDINL